MRKALSDSKPTHSALFTDCVTFAGAADKNSRPPVYNQENYPSYLADMETLEAAFRSGETRDRAERFFDELERREREGHSIPEVAKRGKRKDQPEADSVVPSEELRGQLPVIF